MIPTIVAAPKSPTVEKPTEPKINTSYFVDREERAVAALLTRFKSLVTLVAMPAADGAAKEVAASHAFQMEVEGNALVRSCRSHL